MSTHEELVERLKLLIEELNNDANLIQVAEQTWRSLRGEDMIYYLDLRCLQKNFIKKAAYKDFLYEYAAESELLNDETLNNLFTPKDYIIIKKLIYKKIIL